jgi:hypothetical protein
MHTHNIYEAMASSIDSHYGCDSKIPKVQDPRPGRSAIQMHGQDLVQLCLRDLGLGDDLRDPQLVFYASTQMVAPGADRVCAACR